MFATIDDLGNKIYEYQVEQITQGDSTIVNQALLAAEMEVKGYLTENNRRKYTDGRLHYDVNTIFTSTGEGRHALLLTITLTIAKWYIVELCNADVIYETAKERYDRAINLLKQIGSGELTLNDLPLIEQTDETQPQTLRYGSRTKFIHE